MRWSLRRENASLRKQLNEVRGYKWRAIVGKIVPGAAKFITMYKSFRQQLHSDKFPREHYRKLDEAWGELEGIYDAFKDLDLEALADDKEHEAIREYVKKRTTPKKTPRYNDPPSGDYNPFK